MKLTGDSDICTNTKLRDFGGPYMTGNWAISGINNAPFQCGADFQEFKEELSFLIKQYDNIQIHYAFPRAWQKATITATTSSLQDRAEEFLKEFGFTQVGPFH